MPAALHENPVAHVAAPQVPPLEEPLDEPELLPELEPLLEPLDEPELLPEPPPLEDPPLEEPLLLPPEPLPEPPDDELPPSPPDPSGLLPELLHAAMITAPRAHESRDWTRMTVPYHEESGEGRACRDIGFLY